MSWLGTWSKRLKLTIDSSKIDTADLTDFPVLVKLSTSSGIGDVDASPVFDELTSDANRKKIAVTTSNGTTQCYVEIEKWNDANEEAWLHVKVPSVAYDADTILYLYYDSAQADNTTYIGDTTDAVTHNVWDANFVAVYHMAQDPNGDAADAIKDSTSNANDGTPSGTMLTADLVSGKAGDGIDFDGTDDVIDLGNDSSLDLTTDLTLEILAYSADWRAEDWAKLISKGSPEVYSIYVDKSTATTMASGYLNCEDWEFWAELGELVDSSWHYLAMAYDGSETDYWSYNNGVEIENDVDDPNDVKTNSGDLYLARSGAGAYNIFGPGIIDEVRISSAPRSVSWIKATYNSLWDSLITFEIDNSFVATAAALTITANTATISNDINVSASTPALTVTENAAAVSVNGSSSIFYPVSGNDDWFFGASGMGVFYNDTDYLHFGIHDIDPGAIETRHALGIRFNSVNIPKDVNVLSAHIRVTAYGTASTTLYSSCRFCLDANPSAPGNVSEAKIQYANDTSPVTPFGSPTSAWTDGATYDTVPLADILQEVFDNPTWTYGDAVIGFINVSNGDNPSYRRISSVDYLAGAEKAELHVTWERVSVNVSTTTASLTLTLQAAIIYADTGVSTTSAPLTLTLQAAVISNNIEITANSAPLTLTLQAAVISNNIEITANSASLTLTLQAATVVPGTLVSTSLASLNIVSGNTCLKYDRNVFAAVAVAIVAPQTSTISWELNIPATSQAFTITPYDATIWDGAEWAAWLLLNYQKVIRKYTFTLTGEDDGEEDIDIPFSSFQCRRRNGEPTYLSVVVKDLDYSSAIAARSNGDMKITMSYIVNGTTVYEDIISIVDLENIQLDRGGSNQSISLTGHRTISYTPKSIELRDVTYYRLKDGKYIYRCAAPDLYLAPGDTATFGEISFVVDQVQYTVSVLSQMMQVKEA